MQNSVYQEKSPEERKIFLRDTCDKIENFSFEKSYTNQDVEVFCDRLSKIMIDVRQMETELSKIKKEYAEKLKPMKIELTELLNNIKFRSQMVTEQVYIFIDFEKNEVGYYTGEGILVHKRMLRIDEHQRSIMSSMRSEYNNDEEEKEEEAEEEQDFVEIVDEVQ